MCETPQLSPIDTLKQFGNFSLAYTSLQASMQQFKTDIGIIGYQTYTGINGHTVTAVLADPLCKPKDKQRLLQHFLSKHDNCIVVQCSEDTARTLGHLGLHIMPFGHEHHIDLNSFRLNWRDHKAIKRSVNYYQSRAQFSEKSFAELDMKQLQAMIQTWRQSRTSQSATQGFLVRPFDYQYEVDCRYFLLEQNGNYIAFVVCDPLYVNQRIHGYYVSHSFFDPNLKHSAMKALLVALAQQLRTEGLQTLSLGVSPFVNTDDFPFLKRWHRAFHFLARQSSDYIYNFKGLSQLKSSFKAGLQQSFIASHKRFPVIECIGVAKLVLNYQA